MRTQTKLIKAKDLHKYVWCLLGVFFLFIATFPIACIRVSQDKKFAKYNFHLKSLTIEYKPQKLSGKSSSVQPQGKPHQPSQSPSIQPSSKP